MSDLVDNCLTVALLQPSSINKELDYGLLIRAFETTLEGSVGQFDMLVDKLRDLCST